MNIGTNTVNKVITTNTPKDNCVDAQWFVEIKS